MRLLILTAALLTIAAGASAQTDGNRVHAEIGNRANGLDYQPTPGEVRPREKAAGVAPSPQQERREDQSLFRMDAESLRQMGMSTKSVPDPSKPR